MLKAERVQRLSENNNGTIQYITEDVIEGFLSPLVHFLYGKHIQSGFNSLAKSLKNYIENE